MFDNYYPHALSRVTSGWGKARPANAVARGSLTAAGHSPRFVLGCCDFSRGRCPANAIFHLKHYPALSRTAQEAAFYCLWSGKTEGLRMTSGLRVLSVRPSAVERVQTKSQVPSAGSQWWWLFLFHT